MEYKEVEAFYWVAMLRSFSRAADRLDTSQPTISARIAGLEKRLSARLLDRGAREVLPTPKGVEMLAWAERILSLHQHAEHAVSKSTGHQGIVRVGVSETIVHTWLPAFVQAVEEAYPRLSLELTVDITPRLRDEIVAQELDLAFLLGPISDPTMHNLPLSKYPLSFMAAPRLGLSGRTISLEKLAEFALITYPRRTKPTIALREIFRLHDTRQPRLFASASLSANIRLAMDGVGVAMLPPALVRAELSSRRLEIVSTEVELEALEFTITHSKILTSPIIAGIAEIARSVALAAEE